MITERDIEHIAELADIGISKAPRIIRSAAFIILFPFLFLIQDRSVPVSSLLP